jgi:hypothetical protein
MKEDRKGSPNGIDVIDYKKGKTYDMPADLAEPWIDQGFAAAVKGKAPEETKVIEPGEKKVIEPEEKKVDEPSATKEPPGPEEKKEKEPPGTKTKK